MRNLETLSTHQLTASLITKRLEAPTSPRHMRGNIETILPNLVAQGPTEYEQEPSAKKGDTAVTARLKKLITCSKYKKTICGEYRNDVFRDCLLIYLV